MKPKLTVAILFGTLWLSPVYAGDPSPLPVNASNRATQLRRTELPRFTPEERKKRRQEIRRRLTVQVSELQKKRTDGTLNGDERRRLERLEKLSARFDRLGGNANIGSTVVGSPAGNPTNGKASAKSQ